MICSRVKDSDKKKSNCVKEINRLFVAIYIVPIWRHSDGSHGKIGDVVQIKDVPTNAWIPKPPKENFESINVSEIFDNMENLVKKIIIRLLNSSSYPSRFYFYCHFYLSV